MDKFKRYAKDLLRRMTLEEKVAQMSQTVAGYRCYVRSGEEFTFVDELKDFVKNYGAMGALSNILRSCAWTKKDWGIGVEPHQRVKVANQLQQYVLENSRLGIPVLIQVEANHGLQALGSEIFPTGIGMGSAFNPELYRKIMASIGKETRLSGNHIDFVTMLDMARDPRWGRVEEFFSEDPYLAAQYAANGVAGIKSEGALACCKHFCATGDCFGGINAAEVNIGQRELRDIYLPVAKAAVQNGADVIMAAYNTVDGIPCHANKHLLRDLLRNELGFDGILLSDGWGVERMIRQMGFDLKEGSVLALRSGIDLSLADNGAYLHLIQAAKEDPQLIALIDEAVTRILAKKYALGLFDDPFVEDNGALRQYLASGEQKQLSYQAACESVVMVKNSGILPMTSQANIALIGENADNLYYMLGDYTSLRKPGEEQSVKEAFCDCFASVQYEAGWHFTGGTEEYHARAMEAAEKADVIVVTLGGSSASAIVHTQFDHFTGAAVSSTGFLDCGECHDVASLSLPGDQLALLRKLRTLGKPIVSILIQGRPYLITEVEALSDAVLIAWYPGLQGGRALADILTGRVNPSGKLSVSIPFAEGCVPIYYNRLDDPMSYYYHNHLWTLHPFGYGLSYSTFAYSGLEIRRSAPNEFTVSAEIRNTSQRDGYETVQLYIHGSKNSIRRRHLELRGFEKVFLKAGAAKTVTFRLGPEALKIWSAENRYEIENAAVDVFVGSNPELPLRGTLHTTAAVL